MKTLSDGPDVRRVTASPTPASLLEKLRDQRILRNIGLPAEGLAILALAGAPMLIPRTAEADPIITRDSAGVQYAEIAGIRVRRIELPAPLAQLEEQGVQYQIGEVFPGEPLGGGQFTNVYGNRIIFPARMVDSSAHDRINVTVFLGSHRTDGDTNYIYLISPWSESEYNLSGFVDVVERLGSRPDRMQILLLPASGDDPLRLVFRPVAGDHYAGIQEGHQAVFVLPVTTSGGTRTYGAWLPVPAGTETQVVSVSHDQPLALNP